MGQPNPVMAFSCNLSKVRFGIEDCKLGYATVYSQRTHKVSYLQPWHVHSSMAPGYFWYRPDVMNSSRTSHPSRLILKPITQTDKPGKKERRHATKNLILPKSPSRSHWHPTLHFRSCYMGSLSPSPCKRRTCFSCHYCPVSSNCNHVGLPPRGGS